MSKKIFTTIAQVRRLQQERARILRQLLRQDPLLRGSLSLVKRTCGKPGCHCAQEPSHEAWVLATSHGPGGRRRCQVVRQDDVEAVQERLRVYQDYRTALRELEAIQKKQKAILRGLMETRDEPYE
jgi:hypothetical protein